MREVRLYGELGRRYGRTHRYDVRTPAEAVRALCANFPGFERAVIDIAPAYRVWAGAERIARAEDLRLPSGAREVIRIAPVIGGAGNGGLGKVVLGAALIVASFYLPVTPLFTLGQFAPSMASIAFSVGFSMVLGGITQMLSPSPEMDAGSGERPDNKPSYAFNGAVNTSAQGQAVAIGYGRMIVGSATISAGINADDIAQEATNVVESNDEQNTGGWNGGDPSYVHSD